MRIQVAFAMLVALGCSAAAAGDVFHERDRYSAAMIYFDVKLGAKRAEPSFGLRLQQFVPGTQSRSILGPAMHAIPILDLRWNARGQHSAALNGAVMWDSMESVGEDSWRSPWLWGLVGLGVVGASCATDNWPCEDDDDGYDPPSEDYVPPGE